jgi:hypothetical protein
LYNSSNILFHHSEKLNESSFASKASKPRAPAIQDNADLPRSKIWNTSPSIRPPRAPTKEPKIF